MKDFENYEVYNKNEFLEMQYTCLTDVNKTDINEIQKMQENLEWYKNLLDLFYDIKECVIIVDIDGDLIYVLSDSTWFLLETVTIENKTKVKLTELCFKKL